MIRALLTRLDIYLSLRRRKAMRGVKSEPHVRGARTRKENRRALDPLLNP